ncbi:tyrosine-type recombinase/integrase [Parendozoicomonas haliclonae]|uniref:Site-specific tyrosine recombinase XerC n=2 Tax=Parendozoicomonas haliclonae TaxID=1960125 RepID=A0A1X7AEN0_9GAMM|nr:site-specific tyrosine recombinase XerC [Parendozoicomonas haliclonae]
MRNRRAYVLKFKDLPKSEDNIQYAGFIRGQIMRKLKAGEFRVKDYMDTFEPDNALFREYGTAVSKTKDTVSDLLDMWWKAKKDIFKNSTALTYKRNIRRCKEFFGDKLASELTTNMIEKKLENSQHNKTTLRVYLTPLKNAYKWAIKSDGSDISNNPVVGFEVPLRPRKVEKEIAKRSKEIKVFSGAELKAIRENSGDTIWVNAALFQAFTGIRTGELMPLTWGDVDLDKGVASINKRVYSGEEDDPKTVSSTRLVDLDPPAIEALMREKERTGRDSGVVFVGSRKKRKTPCRQSAYSKGFKKVCQKAGVEYRDTYQLRHTFASRQIAKREDVVWIAQQMGHANTKMLIETYGIDIMRGDDGKYVRKSVQTLDD